MSVETPVPADVSMRRSETDIVQIKTRKTAARQAEVSRTAYREKAVSHQVPHSVSEEPSHVRTEPSKIKTREYTQREVHACGDAVFPPTEYSAPDRRSPYSKIQKIRQTFRRRTSSTSCLRQESAELQTRTGRKFSSPETGVKGSSIHQRSSDIRTESAASQPLEKREFPSPAKAIKENSLQQKHLDIKTKDVVLHRQTTDSISSPASTYRQGEREFVQERGRRETVRRVEARRSRARNVSPSQTNGEKSSLQCGSMRKSCSYPAVDVPTFSPPEQSRALLNSTSSRIEKSFRQATKDVVSKERNAVKASRAGIKNSCRVAEEAGHSVKATQKTAKAAIKTTQQTTKATRFAAKAGAATVKESVKASFAAIKSAITATQELIAALAAGGWAVILVVLVICMAGLLIASPYGIFFSNSSSPDTITPTALIAQIDQELDEKMSELQESGEYDHIEIQGQPPDWRGVLAVFAVINADNSGMDRAELLREVFWNMTKITTESKTIEHPASGNNAAWTETVLTIRIKARTTDDMRVLYQLSDQQNGFLDDLLSEENSSLWDNLLSGGSEEIVSVALSQVGNIGGQPYWSWYGFDSHVNWCACFVSWCANECGYIQAGIIPRFASCTAGSNWFKTRGLWKPHGTTPSVGDLIFFDWDTDGLPDHVGIVERVEDGKVYTIEGNSSDKCRQRSYNISYSGIFGYGTPNY